MTPVLVDIYWKKLLPLTFAKPVSHLLIGIDTIIEKWQRHLGESPEVLPPKYLRSGFPFETKGEVMLINSAALPSPALVEAVRSLKSGQVLTNRGRFIAASANSETLEELSKRINSGEEPGFSSFGKEEVFFNEPVYLIESPADIFTHNDAILRSDYAEITKNYRSLDLPAEVIVKGNDVFIHPEAKINHCVLNATAGPIYIGKDAEIMEGSLIRGPFAIGESSVLKMGTKIYGATSVGKHCKVGGEVNNCIINDYSNKGHDGFLGNSVIGSWCNLGADTNTSNLKNNYGEVKVWNYTTEKIENTGLLFHGLIMGDHSKAGINTMFNTGTVVGMCVNIFDSGFPPKFIPSFSWGSAAKGFETFKLEKAEEAAAAMMTRRNLQFDAADREIFQQVYSLTEKLRQ